LYEQHAATLRCYLAAFIDDACVAEDLCQDTFLQALSSRRSRWDDLNRIGWLYRIARNIAWDELRRRQRITLVPLHEASARPSGDSVDLHIEGAQVLAGLPPDTREILRLFGAGYRAQEIAQMMGTTSAVVKVAIARGRQRLRTGLSARETA